MSTLACKPGVEEVVQRLRLLYERRAGDRILATMDVPSPALDDFGRRYPQPECEYPDPAERADYWDRLWRERAAVEDDSMPATVLSEFERGALRRSARGRSAVPRPQGQRLGIVDGSAVVEGLVGAGATSLRPVQRLVAAIPEAARSVRRARAGQVGRQPPYCHHGFELDLRAGRRYEDVLEPR